MDNNQIDNRKLLGTIFGGIAFILCILFFTYAWYTWRSGNTALNSTIVDYTESSKIVNLDNDGNIEVSNIGPVLNLEDGVMTGFSADNVGTEDVTIYMYLNIESIDQELLNESFKYAIVKSVVSPRTSSYDKETLVYDYDNPITTGSFEDFGINSYKIGQDVVGANSINFYKVIFYIDGNMKNDNSLMNKSMSANLVIKDSNFVDEVMAVDVGSDYGIDFSKTSEESDTNGVYVRDGTENDTNPIYYYRGSVDNNLIFANTCWKIVRTTETGGLKLLYNGTPTDGKCNNTGTATQIGTSAFNTSYKSLTFVGYMYGTVYNYSSKTMSSITDTYYYGNDVSYSNGTYTLQDTISSSSWSSIYNGGLNNYHYTCFGETTCNSVSYIYYTDSTTAYYITLTGGKRVEDALSEMLDYNTTSSTIKGDKNTAGTIDYWYYHNIEDAGYSSYIEDTVWCNDRSVSYLNGWNPDGGSTVFILTFSAHTRSYATYRPDLICNRDIDKFTKDDSNGNGGLNYPVGLITADEAMIAGGKGGTENSSYYLYSGEVFWGNSPGVFSGLGAGVIEVNEIGGLGIPLIHNKYGVRPAISLKPGVVVSRGSGSVSDPYVVG